MNYIFLVNIISNVSNVQTIEKQLVHKKTPLSTQLCSAPLSQPALYL